MMFAFALAFTAQFALVSGQVLLKRAVAPISAAIHARRWSLFALAISCMTLYFFIWLGVAGYLPLSQLAPFDAFGPVLLVIWARLALGERLSARAWLAVGVILLGVSIIGLT